MSAANHGLPTGLTRSSTVLTPAGPSASIASAAVRRAPSLSPGATASSRSTAATSGAKRGIFAIMSARVPGMNSMLRTRVSSGTALSPVPGASPVRAPGPAASGRHRIIAARTAMQTVSPRWLMPWCSKVTMPVDGRDRDRRASRTSVTTWIVSPVNTGAGKSTREKPRLATVVPSVSSGTASPTTRPSVNRLLTSGRPNSVPAANSASRCSGCGFIVIVVNSTLSVSVTVRVVACSTRRPGSSCSNHSPEAAITRGGLLRRRRPAARPAARPDPPWRWCRPAGRRARRRPAAAAA